MAAPEDLGHSHSSPIDRSHSLALLTPALQHWSPQQQQQHQPVYWLEPSVDDIDEANLFDSASTTAGSIMEEEEEEKEEKQE